METQEQGHICRAEVLHGRLQGQTFIYILSHRVLSSVTDVTPAESVCLCLSVLCFTILEALESLLPPETLDGILRHAKKCVFYVNQSQEPFKYVWHSFKLNPVLKLYVNRLIAQNREPIPHLNQNKITLYAFQIYIYIYLLYKININYLIRLPRVKTFNAKVNVT